MSQLSCGLGRGGKPAAPVTLIAVVRDKIMIRNLLKFIRALIIIFLLFNVGVIAYSILWLRPHAKRALKEFKSSVAVGMKIEGIQAIASKVGANNIVIFDLSPPRNEATKEVVIFFHMFAGGLSADICRVYLRDNIAIKVEYSYRE